MTGTLPPFSADGYLKLLRTLKSCGSRFLLLGDLPATHRDPAAVYLRHDIDCHPAGALHFAELEAGEGIAATYYILLSAHYNPRSRTCRQVLDRLVAMNHEIGLHYDLSEYPQDSAAASALLETEARQLSDITGKPVRTISCHQPHKGWDDPFKSGDAFVHCHDPRFTAGMGYVSDSCRGWRDETLLEWTSSASATRGLQLLTHPELWLDGSVTDRMQYAAEILEPLCLREIREEFFGELRQTWMRHEGARRHDERIAKAPAV